MKIKRPRQRKIYLIEWLLYLGLFLFSAYLQFSQGLKPCPLCVIQRIVVVLLLFLYLSAYLHNPEKGKAILAYNVIGTMLSGFGALVAWRHLYLQNLPPEQMPKICAPDLYYMLHHLPYQKLVQFLFDGMGECNEVQWVLFDKSLPEWLLIIFIAGIIFPWLRLSYESVQH